MISNYLSKVSRLRASGTALTLSLLVFIIVCATVVTWVVLTNHVRQEEETARANHPLRIVSSDSASSTLYDQYGNQTTLAPYAENWTVVTSWATWCPACREQLVSIAAVQTTYAERGVVAIAYNRTEPTHTIEAFTELYPLPSNLVFVRDTTDGLYGQFNGTTMPETVILSPTGEVTHHFRGPVSESTLRQVLDSIVVE